MKMICCAVAILFGGILMFDGPVQESVSIHLGPKAYRDGDVIEITGISSTSPELEQGDTITITGRVRLDSVESAHVCLFLTQTEGDGTEETEATQIAGVNHGLSEFELNMTIKHRGFLHLTLYDKSTGKPFGGVYFGTKEQVAKMSPAIVKHYLDE